MLLAREVLQGRRDGTKEFAEEPLEAPDLIDALHFRHLDLEVAARKPGPRPDGQ